MSITDILQESAGNGAVISGDKIYGVRIAIVTNNNDPDKIGRVKLKFPWRGESDESDWTRMVFPMAGKERGIYFIPEVDDEVLVLFENGDIHHPYVVGALWNGQDKPPESNANGKNNIRKIKSRSGHEIIFDDNSEEQKEKLEIHTKSGHTILLDDATGQEKIEIKDKTGNNKIVFDSTQNAIQIESTMKLSIKSQVIEIEASATMTIKSSGTMTLQGTMININ